ncbi:MAG: FHA domain-containing protein [Propionibacteriaceae bacterium]|nr:FHA domain-containing protein [Propionibacteriaceae bacterium]
MSELVLLAFKLGFIAALWLFVLITGSFIKTDLFGRKVSATELVAEPGASPQVAGEPKVSRRKARKLPKTLVVTHGPQAGQTRPLDEPILIGRAADCALLLDDDYVSTRHARIVRKADGCVVEDLGSTNGTFVNNQRIVTPTAFGIGDTIRIGRTLLTVER